jgi:predicted kinase
MAAPPHQVRGNIMKSLIVINGPIGAGKSSVAQAIVDEFRIQGRSAAVIDLDLLYLMMSDKPMGDENVWQGARRAAAALTDSFDSSGVDVVILEGQFWDRAERAPFEDNLNWSGKPFFVTLQISYDEALHRVSRDASRGISQDAEFLKKAHIEFAAILEPLKSTDYILDSTHQTPVQLAEAIINEEKKLDFR